MNKVRLIAAICLAVLVSLFARSGFAEERLVVVSDRGMPYNGLPGSIREGYAVEILRAVFEPRGYTVEYLERPWKRAVDDVRAGRADVLIRAVQSEMEDFVYPTRSLGRADLCFFTTLPDWEYTGHGSLALVTTGMVPGHSYPRWFRDDVRTHPGRFQALHGEDALSRLLLMLKEGRVQVVPGSTAVVSYYARENGLQDEIRLAGCSDPDARDLYFAFTPANLPRSRLLADILDRGMATLRNTGQLNHLLIKYGLKDWIDVR